QLPFRNRETYVDRLDARNRDERRIGVGLDQVADVRLQVAGPAVDRRANLGVLQVQAGGLERGLVGLDRGGPGRGARVRLIILLTGADLFLPKVEIALFVGARLCGLGLV